MDELRTALELADEDELQALSQMLFQPKFNPLDYLYGPAPQMVQSLSRDQQIGLMEDRFRFLAADGFSVLNRRSHRLTYRQVLLQVCRYLRVNHYHHWSAEDLEAEIFLHLIERCWNRLPAGEKRDIQGQIRRSFASQPEFRSLPSSLQTNPMGLILKGGSALAVTSILSPWLLRQITAQFAWHLARHEIAKQSAVRAGGSAVAAIQSRAALHMASRGVAMNAARFGATRTLLAWTGPVLWGWFLADLGWRAIATNYGRVIPVIFTLAQIRLTRSVAPACG
ncbi:hypothetical protein C7271_24300 [filamentous cyanobacterium CCP5]|nr:hypothetical protein C7271_24300 [filamentous cyanobacterium CCP5]